MEGGRRGVGSGGERGREQGVREGRRRKGRVGKGRRDRNRGREERSSVCFVPRAQHGAWHRGGAHYYEYVGEREEKRACNVDLHDFT